MTKEVSLALEGNSGETGIVQSGDKKRGHYPHQMCTQQKMTFIPFQYSEGSVA